jgi:hypothetical protein
MPQKKCKICDTEFYVKPSHIKLGYGKYCSAACHHQGLRKGKLVHCHICEKEAWKQPKALKNSKSGKFFCSKSCQTKWRNKEYKGTKHANWQGGEYTYYKVMKENNVPPVCKDCGIKNRRVLVIHHKDSNRKNNQLENLIWLCRNCHYLVHNGKTV